MLTANIDRVILQHKTDLMLDCMGRAFLTEAALHEAVDKYRIEDYVRECVRKYNAYSGHAGVPRYVGYTTHMLHEIFNEFHVDD